MLALSRVHVARTASRSDIINQSDRFANVCWKCSIRVRDRSNPNFCVLGSCGSCSCGLPLVLRGAPGPKGDLGFPGFQGSSGPTGPRGEYGVPGDTGETGEQVKQLSNKVRGHLSSHHCSVYLTDCFVYRVGPDCRVSKALKDRKEI